MKVADVLAVLNMVEEEMEKGVEYKREQCKYEFVRPVSKAERLANKGKNKKK
jgi:hypothetical protein